MTPPAATMAHALNSALRDALADDPDVVLMGEDIGALGGVFRVTDGLRAAFGDDRVMDTPLAESGIIGTAIGLAMCGFRPVCEIQFDGFVYPAFDQIVSQLAKLRSRSGGDLRLPLTIRIPFGGGIGAVEHHSESPEAYFVHTAGLRVVAPSTAQDAYEMLRASIASDDPVVFMEPKRRYWSKSPFDPLAPRPSSHRAATVRPGRDVTLVGYGPTVQTCVDAADAAAQDGLELEVIDLRSLSPLDTEAVVASVRRTGRCIVVHEAPRAVGMGAEVAAAVTEGAFEYLESPVLRVTGWSIPYPPAAFEEHYLPSPDRVLAAVDEVMDR